MTRTINFIALAVLLGSTVLGIYWPWGLLFLWWVITSVMAGQGHLVFDINRAEEPILFWTVVVLWALFGSMMIAADLFPQYAPWLI